MKLTELLRGVKCQQAKPAKISRISIVSATNDSRAVGKGWAFVAVQGATKTGHGYIGEAISRGAGVVIAERDFSAPEGVVKVICHDGRGAMAAVASNLYGDPSKWLKMIGVTGTNGKTTITYILERIIAAAGSRPGVIGTVNCRYAGKVLPAKNTTPGPFELQSLLDRMRRSRVRYCCMEVSSHALDQQRVDGILFDAAVFTNLTPEHLDYHRTVPNYFKAKALLFNKLKKGGCAVLNADDPMAAKLRSYIGGKIITYGVIRPADVSAVAIELSLEGTRFIAVTPSGSVEITTPLIGRHNVSNCLAAIAVATAEGIGLGAIRRALSVIPPVPGRLEPVDAGQAFKVFVDFAHTPDALRNVLSLITEVTHGDIITVFGCGGDRDRSKRPVMGLLACRFSDKVIITSDNPRSEEPKAIIAQIVRGAKGYSNYEVVPDRRAAIRRAIRGAAGGDIVLIAGKGHEKCQIVKGRAMPFDDRTVAMAALAERARR